MTAERNDLILRPITGPEELDLFSRLPYVFNAELADDLAAGRRRPGWMWVAIRGDRLLARLTWWGRSGARSRSSWMSLILTTAARISTAWTSAPGCFRRPWPRSGRPAPARLSTCAWSRPAGARTGQTGASPEHRGNGYIDEILAEGTRILVAQDVPRIRAATDLGNTPMADAFRRAGYVNFERTINLTWRPR